MPRLFDREYTTKAGHSGVGLHLVKSVVDRTGGTITIEPKRPAGLSVMVSYGS